MTNITALDLEQWSDWIGASGDLPRLVSQLVWATAKDLSYLDMPCGELTRLSGFDGFVICGIGDDILPQGASAWEMSVEKRAGGKAEDDYTKRSEDPKGVDKSQTTFVFVTPRRWRDGEAWAKLKRAQKEWKDVRVIRSQHLERWLARAPWIAAEFAANALNRPIAGIESLGMVWTGYSMVALGSLSEIGPEFVLADRSSIGDSLVQWLTSDVSEPEKIIRFSGPSVREALHFIAAKIWAMPLADRLRYESRLFMVHDKSAAQALGGLGVHHVVLVQYGDALPHVLAARKRYGCRVVIIHREGDGEPLGPPNGLKHLKLEPMSRNLLNAFLMRLGWEQDKAAEVCARCNYDYEQVRLEAKF